MSLGYTSLIEALSDDEKEQIAVLFGSNEHNFGKMVTLMKLDRANDFRMRDLSGINFQQSDLRFFDFTGANLQGTEWKDAIYDQSTIILHANLTEAKNCDLSRFESDCTSSFTDERSTQQHRLPAYQSTVRKQCKFSGNGVHSNAEVTVVVRPSRSNEGIVFICRNTPNGEERRVKARWFNMMSMELGTVLGDPNLGSVASVEHILSALAGLDIDNAEIFVDGPEIPILDGSSYPFVNKLSKCGTRVSSTPRKYLRVLKAVSVEAGGGYAELRPFDGRRFDISIDFDDEAIGIQSIRFDLNPDSYSRVVAGARNFGKLRDVERLWKLGFCLGSSLENTIAVDAERILNPEGLRMPDEFVKHKLLDAIGDLMLLGHPVIGRFTSNRAGHKTNILLMRKFMEDRSAWDIVSEGNDRGLLEPKDRHSQWSKATPKAL